jgi:hypothetical protein
MIDIERIEKTKWFRYLLRYRLIDRREVRNLRIRLDFERMRREMCAFDAFYLLSEKYGLSPDTIQTILFRSSRRKNDEENKDG